MSYGVYIGLTKVYIDSISKSSSQGVLGTARENLDLLPLGQSPRDSQGELGSDLLNFDYDFHLLGKWVCNDFK